MSDERKSKPRRVWRWRFAFNWRMWMFGVGIGAGLTEDMTGLCIAIGPVIVEVSTWVYRPMTDADWQRIIDTTRARAFKALSESVFDESPMLKAMKDRAKAERE